MKVMEDVSLLDNKGADEHGHSGPPDPTRARTEGSAGTSLAATAFFHPKTDMVNDLQCAPSA